MKMTIEVKPFPLHEPFVITGYTFHVTEVVWVTLTDGDAVGRGEAVVSSSIEETAAGMAATLESVKAEVEAGATRTDVQRLLPSGGARNALDCAFWDLEAKRSGTSVWNTLQIIPKPLATVATIVIGSPEKMAADAAGGGITPVGQSGYHDRCRLQRVPLRTVWASGAVQAG